MLVLESPFSVESSCLHEDFAVGGGGVQHHHVGGNEFVLFDYDDVATAEVRPLGVFEGSFRVLAREIGLSVEDVTDLVVCLLVLPFPLEVFVAFSENRDGENEEKR